MYKTTSNLRGLSSSGAELNDVWESMVMAYTSKGVTDLKNLKNQRLTAEQLDPYYFRAVNSYLYENSPDELFKFMDYIWAWSSGYEFSNNDSAKVGNFTDPNKYNFAFTNSNRNTPTYLVWLTFTMNNNGSIDKESNWLNHRTAFNDRNTVAKTPVIATIRVARLSDATPLIITGTKVIDGSSNKYTKHTNSFGEYVSWQSNWDWNTGSKTNAFSVRSVNDGVYGLVAMGQIMMSNCAILNDDKLKVVWNKEKLHIGLGLIDKIVYSNYGQNANEFCPSIRAITYDCYSYEYLYYKYGAMPVKLRDETNTKGITNKHLSKVPDIVGIYQMPNGDYYWSADGIFFCNWTEPTPLPDDKKDIEIIIEEGDKKMSNPCPAVKCYTETSDKKLYLNRVQMNSDDIPFAVRQKTTKCTPKDTIPKQKYYCEDNEIDEKIYRLLEAMGGNATGGGVQQGQIGGSAVNGLSGYRRR